MVNFSPPQFPVNPVKKKLPRYANDNIIESLRNLGQGVGKSMTRDVVGRIGADALSSLFGKAPSSGELRANESLDLNREALGQRLMQREMAPRAPYVRPEEINLKPQIEAVRAELKALASSLKNLHQEIQKAVEEVPVQPGIYHLNFFERLRSIIRILRQQIEDSRTWLNLWTSRRKKAGYWGMYKKHGTNFGLSSERSLATSAG